MTIQSDGRTNRYLGIMRRLEEREELCRQKVMEYYNFVFEAKVSVAASLGINLNEQVDELIRPFYDDTGFVFTLCGNKCLCCGRTDKLERDRIVPRMLDGNYAIDNIQPLCRSCNARKQTKIIDYRSPKVADAIVRYAAIENVLYAEYKGWIAEWHSRNWNIEESGDVIQVT